MKYFLTILVTAIVVSAGAYVYFKGLPRLTPYNSNPVATESAVGATNSATPTPQSGTLIKAGGILVFKAYSLELPVGWTSSTDGSIAGQIDKLTLAYGTYKIVFTQAAMGGGGCVYPGQPSQDMSVTFNAFDAVTTSTGEKLRVGVLPSGNRAVCEMQNGSWGDLTEFGHIDITNPPTPDQAVLTQINSILSSLVKQ